MAEKNALMPEMKLAPKKAKKQNALAADDESLMDSVRTLINALSQTQDQYGYRNMADRVYDPQTGQFYGVAGLLGMPGQDVASQMSAVNQAGRAALASGGGFRDVSAARDAAGAMDVAAALNFLGNIKAYHGSPHSFDRFDMSKIGTGEGAQAYGHGLYFAENEGVARAYRDTLSKGFTGADGSAISRSMQSALEYIHPKFKASGDFRGGLNDAIQRMTNQAEFYRKTYGPGPNLYDSAVERLKAINPDDIKPAGHMYEVNIKAKPEEFLDWDKPLSQQSEKVREGVRNSLVERGIATAVANYLRNSDRPGRDALTALARGEYDTRFMPPEGEPAALASAKLREAGIPGIKYLDQGSRSAGQGSSNYVVFDDKLIDILKRYGIAAGLLGAGGNALMGGAGADGGT